MENNGWGGEKWFLPWPLNMENKNLCIVSLPGRVRISALSDSEFNNVIGWAAMSADLDHFHQQLSVLVVLICVSDSGDVSKLHSGTLGKTNLI